MNPRPYSTTKTKNYKRKQINKQSPQPAAPPSPQRKEHTNTRIHDMATGTGENKHQFRSTPFGCAPFRVLVCWGHPWTGNRRMSWRPFLALARSHHSLQLRLWRRRDGLIMVVVVPLGCARGRKEGGESPGPPPSQPRIYSAHWGCGRNPTTTTTTRTLTRVSMVSMGAHRTPPRPTPHISPFIHRRLY